MEGENSTEPMINDVPNGESGGFEFVDPLTASYVPQLDFEMNQKNLTSNSIKPRDLKAKVQQYIESDTLSKNQLIMILKQGAQDNNLFMIGEETYGKLADSLNIPLDEDTGEENFNLTMTIQKSKSDLLQTIRDFKLRKDQEKDNNDISSLMKSKRILNTKSDVEERNNKKRMSQMPAAFGSQKQTFAIDGANDIVGSVKTDTFVQNDKSVQDTKHLLERTPKMTNQALKNNLISVVIIVISLLAFVGWVLQSIFMFNPILTELLGTQIIIARGCALAIIILSMMLLFFVSYDFLTMIRGTCGAGCLSLLDFHIVFHKLCGVLLFLYSTSHTICHLYGTIPAMSNPDNFSTFSTTIKTFGWTETPTPWQVLFGSLPGLTGVILQIAITMLLVTSLECVRRRYFQLFSYTHMFFFPVFIFGTVLHGAQRWLNFGFPTAAPFFVIPVLIYFIMLFRRGFDMCRRPFRVAKIAFVNNKSFMSLNLEVPKGYTWKSGQYAFINVPSISKWQWHPFSIASSPNGYYLSFMIKSAGNWTDKLVAEFAKIKEETFQDIISELKESEYKREFRDHLMEMNFDDQETIEQNKRAYPRINVSRAVSAPAEMAARRRRIICIGAGSGIAPFLALLDDQQVAAQGGRMREGSLAKSYKEEYRATEKAHLILTSRDADQFSWISPYIEKIMGADGLPDKVVLHLYLTSTKCNSLPSFLFWRAFLKREQLKKQGLLHSANPILGSKMNLNVGRPNFEKIIAEIHKKDPGDFFCYCCAPPIIINQAKAACQKVNEENGDVFSLRYEIF